jgi:hypothetical protein
MIANRRLPELLTCGSGLPPVVDQRSIDATTPGDTAPRTTDDRGQEDLPGLATVALGSEDYKEGNGVAVAQVEAS